MRVLAAISLAALLVGCASSPLERTQSVCAEQGHSPGTAEYNACFNAIYPALLADRSRMRAALIAAP